MIVWLVWALVATSFLFGSPRIGGGVWAGNCGVDVECDVTGPNYCGPNGDVYHDITRGSCLGGNGVRGSNTGSCVPVVGGTGSYRVEKCFSVCGACTNNACPDCPPAPVPGEGNCGTNSECDGTPSTNYCERDRVVNDVVIGVCMHGNGIRLSDTGYCIRDIVQVRNHEETVCPCGCSVNQCIYPCVGPTNTPVPTPPICDTLCPGLPISGCYSNQGSGCNWCPKTNQCVCGSCPIDPLCPSDKPNCAPIGACGSGIRGSCTSEQECCPPPPPVCDQWPGFSCQDEGWNKGNSCTLMMNYNGEWRVLNEDVTGNYDLTTAARNSCPTGKDCLKQCNGVPPENMCLVNINPDNISDRIDLDKYDVQVWNVPVAYVGEAECEAANGGSCSCSATINYIRIGPNSTTWYRGQGCVGSDDLDGFYSCTRSECVSSMSTAQPVNDNNDGAFSHKYGEDWKYAGGKVCCDGWRRDTAGLPHNPMCSTPGVASGTMYTPRVLPGGDVSFTFTITGQDNIIAPDVRNLGPMYRLHDPAWGSQPIVWIDDPARTGITPADNADVLLHTCQVTKEGAFVWNFTCKAPTNTPASVETHSIIFSNKYNAEAQLTYEVGPTEYNDTYCRNSVAAPVGYAYHGMPVTYSRGSKPIDWASWMKSMTVGSGGETEAACGEGNAETCSVTANIDVGTSLYFRTDISKIINTNLYVCSGANSSWSPGAPVAGSICANSCKTTKIEICGVKKGYYEERQTVINSYCDDEVAAGRATACGAGEKWVNSISCLAQTSRTDPTKAVWGRYYDDATATCKDPWCNCLCRTNSLPSFSNFKIKNNVDAVVVAEAGARNQICQTEFNNSRSVTFEATIADADGISDISSVILKWGGSSYTMALTGAVAKATVDFPANDNGTDIKDLLVVVTDTAGATNATQDTGRDFKVWDCEVAISGTVYNGSDADFGIPNCSAGLGSGFNVPIDINYGLNYGSKTMTVTGADYDSAGQPLMWSESYSAVFSGLGGLSPKMKIGGVCGLSQVIASSVSAYDVGPSLAADFSVVLNQDAWYQIRGGGARSGANIVDRIPATCATAGVGVCLPAIAIDEGGLVAAGVGIIDKGCNDCQYSNPNDTWHWSGKSLMGVNLYGYTYFKNKLTGRLDSLRTFSVGTSLSQIGIGTTGVVLVDGDVTIDADNTVNPGDFLMVVAKGDIDFMPGVTNSQGIFVADGNINIGGTNSQALTVSGIVYSSAAAVTIVRSFTDRGSNNTTPAVVIRYRPDFVFSMPPLINRLVSGWKYN